jgi:hypothetical protein
MKDIKGVKSFEEFGLGDAEALLESGSDIGNHYGKEIYKYAKTPLDQDLIDKEVIKSGNNASSATPYRPELYDDTVKACKSWVASGPITRFNGKPFNLKFLKMDKSSYPYEIIKFSGKPSYLMGWFEMQLVTKLGTLNTSVHATIESGKVWEFDTSSEEIFYKAYDENPKLKQFFVDAYLRIPDSHKDEQFKLMKSKFTDGGWYSSEYDVPRSWWNEVLETELIQFALLLDGEYTPKDIVTAFKEINKKYYKQWQAIHRKGIKGALKNAKAWFLSLKEHEEYGMAEDLNEYSLNNIRTFSDFVSLNEAKAIPTMYEIEKFLNSKYKSDAKKKYEVLVDEDAGDGEFAAHVTFSYDVFTKKGYVRAASDVFFNVEEQSWQNQYLDGGEYNSLADIAKIINKEIKEDKKGITG